MPIYYRYAVATSGVLKEDIFRTKQPALEHAQRITIAQHKTTRVYRQRRYPTTGQADIIPLVEYWWDNNRLQFWRSSNF